MPNAETWRRRERALGGGLVIWALAVSTAVTIFREATADWILTTEPLLIAGTILISVGLCGGFVETLLLIGRRWAEPSDLELTEVPWDE
jgi:hypothetical protein